MSTTDHSHSHSHGHSHGHGHHHAHMCGGLDHHSGEYTAQQRADLDTVLGFNAAMAAAIDECRDVTAVEAHLDPDPMRYMWVDEGQGRIGEAIEGAYRLLEEAPPLAGHRRLEVDLVEGSSQAARPTAATGSGEFADRRVIAWVEWTPDEGDRVLAAVDGAAPVVVSGEVTDVFRPTACVDAAGRPWVLFAATRDGEVAVWATRWQETGQTSGETAGAWGDPERVSVSGAPSFNQEVVATDDGGLEVCWQASDGARFAIHTRRWNPDAGWGEEEVASLGTERNVWDATLAVLPEGGLAAAWSEYADGGYRIVVRRRDASGQWGEPVRLTRGRDYALHPSLAVTADGRLWCAFDVITVAGHAGSGPTRLRPAEELGQDPSAVEGMREAGDSVPPELLPEVTATIRVVAVEEDGVAEVPGELAPSLDVTPSGLPKLCATPDGGLTVAYRVHRKLPLMTYYWEVAVQQLGADGWLPPTTLRGSDATLEEPSLAATPSGVLVATQTDGRLATALQWTEGFGGRECPYLMEHQGSVIWHGIHGAGVTVTAEVSSVPLEATPAGVAVPELLTDDRREVRRWADSGRGAERFRTQVRGEELALYWGDLHRHSLISRCTAGDEPSLEDFYRYSWDVCEYDFWAVTDHSENSTPYQWWSIQKMADLFLVPDRFVPLYGFEWTSADTGHQNVIFGDVARGAPTFSAFAEGSTDPSGLWAGLDEFPDFPCITIPHHPGAAMVHNDWDYHSPTYSRLVEVFQACRGNYEADGCYRQYADGTREGTFMIDGLLRGHRFGLIASSDHGHGASYVGAFATDLSRGGVFDALQSRRTFAATTRDIVLDVRLESADGAETFMGEVVPAESSAGRLRVHAQGYADLARIDVVSDGRVVHAVVPEPDLPDGWVRVPLRIEWGGAEETTVWDGQVEIDGGRIVATPFWSPEVVAASETSVAWEHTTYSFGEPYGAQRGGVELTLEGPSEATVRVRVRGHDETVALGDLVDVAQGGVRELAAESGHLRLQQGVGGLVSLGSRSQDLEWQVEGRPAFVYVRAWLVDGEMAWSSPIFFD